MKNRMLLDMHTHSTASDGQYSPARLVEMASERRMSLFAITDHDTLSGLTEALKIAGHMDITFIPGIEISAQTDREIHILGYNIDVNSKELTHKCEEFAKSREKRAELICEYLKEKGINVPLQEVQKYAGKDIIARPHFASWLVDNGIVLTRKEAFDYFLDTEDFHKEVIRMKPTCTEAIKLIHNAGGKASLAHPSQYRMNPDELDRFIALLKEEGLDGIECFYSKHTEEETQRYVKLTEKYDLYISCGSDYHGEKIKPDVRFGMELEENFLERLIISLR